MRLDGFYLGKYPVTVGQFKVFAEDTGFAPEQWRAPGFTQTDDHPVVNVSWDDAQDYCLWLSRRTGQHYRLPTEAEWEYACRAGTTTPFWTGDNLTTDQANYDGNFPYDGNPEGEYREMTTPVRTFPANAWGLHDMHGNVWEWCQDWFGSYSSSLAVNPAGPESGSGRVDCGGSWDRGAENCRSAYRLCSGPGRRCRFLGFRLARSFP